MLAWEPYRNCTGADDLTSRIARRVHSSCPMSAMTSSPIRTTSASALVSTAPVVLEPILVERIWGVHSLAPWHATTGEKALAKPIGEIWLTAETCQATGGAGQGQTLSALTAASPEAFGDSRRHGFPLLIKLLFPREKLSVQVHPDDKQAQALGMPRGKTECWYVLSAEPGAQVAVGFREPLTTAQVTAAIHDGSLESRLRMIEVKAGDMVFVDAGTVHAIGPGMVVLETQQYSDTTYRLWDYGRPRELHVEAGMAVTRTTSDAGLVQPEQMGGFTRLVSSPYFLVDRFSLTAGGTQPLRGAEKLQILIALGEGCDLIGNDDAPLPLPRGQAVVLPIATREYSLRADNAVEIVRVLQP